MVKVLNLIPNTTEKCIFVCSYKIVVDNFRWFLEPRLTLMLVERRRREGWKEMA
jgi:hypothetical protein